MENIVKYNNGEIEINISLKNETIWLTQKQIAEVFGVNIPAISKHIKNIYKDEELNQFTTVSILEIVQKEGKREVTRSLEHYNLDIILAVGYRTNSAKAIKFRQWATKVLKSYIQDGYAINSHKITEQRLLNLENDMFEIKSKIKKDELEIKQGIFYDGEVFDAYNFLSKLIKSAKLDIKIIDNYLDESILFLLTKNHNIKTTFYTNSLSKQLKQDIERYNQQYNNLEVKITKNFHDRFIIIDEKEVYHIGASLKDLGKKVFAFSKLNIEVKTLLQNL